MWCRKDRLAALVAVAGACGVPAVRAQEPEPFTLRVCLRPGQVIPARVDIGGVKDETEQLWRPYGVHIEWADTCGGDPAGRGLSIDAALAQRIEEPDRPDGTTVLGVAFTTPVRPGTRSIQVSVDATTRVLARRWTSSSSIAPMVPGRELTRALGRVLAHEIGHVLLDMWFHDETGLMRAAYHPHELADRNRDPFRLAARAVTRLRTRTCALLESSPHRFAPGTCEGR